MIFAPSFESKSERNTEMNTINYTKKLPKTVSSKFKEIALGECFLIERLKYDQQLKKGAANFCHANVDEFVSKYGGERISGWLLHRDKDLFKNDIYFWVFHSVWKSASGAIYDVTENEVYENSKYVTFWVDEKRRADLTNGRSYNSILICQSQISAMMLSLASSSTITAGEAYWSINDLSYFKPFEDHSGIYHFLEPEFLENHAILKEKYGYKKQGNAIIPINGSPITSKEIHLDFALM